MLGNAHQEELIFAAGQKLMSAGNFRGARDDYWDMDCQTARIALSALLDREPVDNQQAVEAHLSSCVACTGWRQGAEALAARMRNNYAETPDLTVRILESTAQQHNAYRRNLLWRRRMLRLAVGTAAVGQLLLAIPALLMLTGSSHADAVHVIREMASFDIALAVGFLLAACYPERARAFLPVACVLSVCLLFSSGVDLAAGETSLMNELSHAVALVQAGLLWALGRTEPKPPQAAMRTVAV